MNYFTIEARLLRRGQPRPYADHECVIEATVTFFNYKGEPEPPFTKLPEENEERRHRIEACLFMDTPTKDKQTDWAGSYRLPLQLVRPGVVRATIITPFTD